MKITNVMFFPNGNTAAFDEEGKQVPVLQQSWLELFLKLMVFEGYDPADTIFMLPTGVEGKMVKSKAGEWYWEPL